jgi:hypothetical protein
MAFGALVGSARGAPVFAVSSTLDEPDATLDGNCVSTPSGLCTLRAAVQEANFAGTATVTVPAGLYVLTRNVVGTDDGSVGDLDIGLSTTDPTKSKAANVTIVGAGADRTIIDGNGSHRVVDIHDDLVDGRGVATISGVSIRDGQTLNDLDSVASHWHGGALHNHGQLTLSDSTVSDSNSTKSGWGGGGITNASSGVALLQNVTFSNDATAAHGGAIENLGAMKLFNVTISQSSAPATQGGGVYGGGASTRLNNTIVAEDTTGGDCAGTIVSVGNNLAGDATCAFAGPGDLNSTNPLLAAVMNTAGSIWVYALQSGSPAIDAGSGPYNGGTDTGCLATDERGVPRPQDGNADGIAVCDIGSYEAQPGLITVTKRLVPTYDPGRFNLLIDGTVYATNVGDGGTTGPIAVLPGSSHTVSETAGTNTILSRYVTTIRCSNGSFARGTSLSGVQAGAGSTVDCTIENTRRLYRVP